jgi:RND family efflux transporter MFP subunit
MTVRKTGRKRLTILERRHELAKKEYGRVRKLFKKNSVGTLAGVEAAEKAVLSVADQINQISQVLETADTNLKRCEARAPFNARIKSVSLEKGQYVTPGQNVLTLADDSVLEIQVPLDSRDGRKWLRFDGEKINAKIAWFSGLEQIPCKISLTENNNGQTWDGRLHRVVKFDQQTRTLTVAVRIDAATTVIKNSLSLPLVEGMFCSVKIPGKILHNVIQLPRQAVSFENTVYLAVSNRLKTVPVKVARIEGEHTYVADGLNVGDMVVITRVIDPLENALLEITNKSQKE